MMRVAWRTSVLGAFCLLTSTATAHAECAWVMWTEERHADGGPIKLSASDAFDTREQCKTRLANTTSLVGKGLGGRVVGNVVIMSSKEGKPSLMFTYFCLPTPWTRAGRRGSDAARRPQRFLPGAPALRRAGQRRRGRSRLDDVHVRGGDRSSTGVHRETAEGGRVTILADYRAIGDALWTRFKGGKIGTLWYYRSLVEAYRKAETTPLIEELDRVVSELERLASPA
jgi:hypothetical protein